VKNSKKENVAGSFTQATAWGVKAVQTGVEAAVAKFHYGTWLMKAKQLQKDLTGSGYGFGTEIYKAVAQKTGRPLNSVQSAGSQAITFAMQYESEQAVRDWFMHEDKKKVAEKVRFSAKRKAESVAKGLTKAQVAALISELKKFA
jgi:hypothetical protein